MRRAALPLLALAVAAASAVALDAAPATQPTTRPLNAATAPARPPARPAVVPSGDPIPVPRPLSRDFATLVSRSIFLKGRQETYAGGGRTDDAPTTREAPARAENYLVFNGVTDVGGNEVVFLEDTQGGRVQMVTLGGAVAGGKVTRISLDSIDFQTADGVKHIQIGQNLAGEDVAPTTQASSSPPSGGGSPPEVAPGGPPAGGAPAGADAVAERLRRRRQQELNGK